MTRRTWAGAVALVVLACGCGPTKDLQVGVQDYNTDVVYGAKKKPERVGQAPAADPFPLFPPPVIELPSLRDVDVAPPLAIQPDATPTTKAPPAACPEAPLTQIPPPAATDVKAAPKDGPYPYRVKADVIKAGQRSTLATTEWRTVRPGAAEGLAAGPAWAVVINRGGDEYTTTYQVERPVGNANLDGIYIRHIVNRRADGTVEEFRPSGLGLRVFALPADLAVSWTSVATDPVHETSVRISATMTQRRRVNACGTVVEGWEVQAAIDATQGKGAGLRQVHTDSLFLVAPQLGGLIVADTSHTVDAGAQLDETVDVTINALTPAAAQGAR